MILVFFSLFLILSVVSIVWLICSSNEQEQKIKDLEEQVENFDILLGHFRRKNIYLNYSLSGEITKLENELKKLKKEIKK